ncbi:Aste57867_21970 [Aphanomyces stellatus]|uniref:Aste57867_21970 protein n=1 Tax=Aphanomyces stellatus TaxID=120398 RepID=A0A485LKA1_9STRA|nr:hypothetical protein As57867_021901 [Aphanomyces stellatus]VFT98638.1 Aste57867_21970 [Aphanomyces stellatus]
MSGTHMVRKFQVQKPLAAAVASGLQVLGGAFLIPTLKLSVPPRANGEYDMPSIVAHARSNWNLRGPVVLDLSNVSSNGSPHVSPIKSSELRSLVRALKEANVVPIGITNASEDVKTMAMRVLQMPNLIGSRLNDQEVRIAALDSAIVEGETPPSDPFTTVTEGTYAKADVTDAASPEAAPSSTGADDVKQTSLVSGMMVVEGSVRTGQQIYAKGQGLIVMGSVNSGAEVLADGDIHVYGVLKGRALAGIGGHTTAKVRIAVYAQKFDAELISIADTFTTCDALEARESGDVVDDRPTIVWLEDGVLRFKSVVPGRS